MLTTISDELTLRRLCEFKTFSWYHVKPTMHKFYLYNYYGWRHCWGVG